jgi:hypothetical protein
MKVKELIAALQGYDEDMEILMSSTWGYDCETEWTSEFEVIEKEFVKGREDTEYLDSEYMRADMKRFVRLTLG